MDEQNNKENVATTDTGATGMNLGGQAASAPMVTGNDERIAELTRELQSARVEAGRVKALSQQLKAKDEEIASLKSQLETLKSANRDFMAELPEDMREVADPTQLKATGIIMEKLLRERDEAQRERDQRREQEAQKIRQDEFYARIRNAYPDFLRDTNPGGDKQAAWEKFLQTYFPSVNAAVQTCNFEAISNIIQLFYREIGVSVNRNPGTTITPKPGFSDGGAPGGEGHVYSFAEYQAALEKAGSDYREGRIDQAKYRALRAELDGALNSGRVKMG